MEYTINQLAKLAGVSTRTLRYYDQCGLLPPKAVRSNGYRIYGETEVNRLQQILFYRELGVELSEIGRILAENDFDGLSALQNHLTALREKRARLDRLIGNVQKSILAMKGETEMTDKEKFEGFKEKLISDNEQKYGQEIRTKYGVETVDRSNAKLKNMTKEQYGELAQKACALHKKWLSFYWDHYSKEAHRGVAQMYVDDPRFTAYYDAVAPGCAVFLRDAVRIFCA